MKNNLHGYAIAILIIWREFLKKAAGMSWLGFKTEKIFKRQNFWRKSEEELKISFGRRFERQLKNFSPFLNPSCFYCDLKSLMKYHRKEKLSIFSLVFGTWCDRDFDIWEQNCNNVTVTWRIKGMTSYTQFDTFLKKKFTYSQE